MIHVNAPKPSEVSSRRLFKKCFGISNSPQPSPTLPIIGDKVIENNSRHKD